MRNMTLAGIFTTATLGLTGPLFAQAINPFESDGCVPGLTASGAFVDQAGNVLDSAGWVAVAPGEVLNAAGTRVLLRQNCLSALQAANATGISAGTASAFVVGLGLVLVGDSNGTNGTNGTN